MSHVELPRVYLVLLCNILGSAKPPAEGLVTTPGGCSSLLCGSAPWTWSDGVHTWDFHVVAGVIKPRSYRETQNRVAKRLLMHPKVGPGE